MKSLKNKSLVFLSMALILGFLNSCKDEYTDPDNFNMGYDYYPDEVGHWVEYKVDSVIYDKFTDSIYYKTGYLRQVWDHEFTDNEGRRAVRVASSYRNNIEDTFNIHPPVMSYFVKTNSKVERVTADLRMVPLTFPVIDNYDWFGNNYIDTTYPDFEEYNDWLFTYQESKVTRTVGSLNFNNTATVIQNDYENKLERIYVEEAYAEEVGLIFKKWQMLELLTSDLTPYDSIPWPDRANKGFDITWTVIDYKQ